MTHAVLSKLRALVTGTPRSECELCAESIAAEHEHEHLLERGARRVFCACVRCARAFSREPAPAAARYLRVERRAVRLPDVDIDDASWAELGVVGGLAFFSISNRTAEVVATFPGRAGIIETFVPLRAWSVLERRFPRLKRIRPEVEALLVRRSPRHHDYFVVSIDYCYELARVLRDASSCPAPPELPAVQTFFSRLVEHATDSGSHGPRKGPPV